MRTDAWPSVAAESVRERVVVLAGGTSAAGTATARALLASGAVVVVVGRSPERLVSVEHELPGIIARECDLTREEAVQRLADEIRARCGGIDGVFSLVGGWRGGGGLAGQNDDDFRFMEQSLTALRHVSRVFEGDLRTSTAGRLAVVSSTAVERPTAGGANYATVKAACETWTRAVAQGYAKSARDAKTELSAAAVIFRVKSLAGHETTLADAFLDLWNAPASALNGEVRELLTP